CGLVVGNRPMAVTAEIEVDRDLAQLRCDRGRLHTCGVAGYDAGVNGRTTLLRAIALVLLGACGRLSFDARGDATDDAGTGSPRSLALPAGGQLTQIAVSPDGTWYATAALGGAFRSTDQGASWTRCAVRIGQAIAVTSDNSVWMAGADV